MMPILVLQLALPLLFIGWTGFATGRNALVFSIQTIGIALALCAVSLTGLWLFPPWWTVWVFGGLFVAAVIFGWRRRVPFPPGSRSRGTRLLSTAILVVIGGWGAYQSAMALAGRVLPPGAVVDLAFPLRGGEYMVVNGGSTIGINAHLATLDSGVARFNDYRGQSYGVDIVKLDSWGLRANGLLPSKPSAYTIYGVPVYAPCTGEAIVAFDGVLDMQVPRVDREHMAGNHVILRCKHADVLLGHLMPASLKVSAGQHVNVGEQIANVGNSGNTSEPHLHIHAQEAGKTTSPLSGNPLPVRFDGRFLVRINRFSLPH